MNRHERRRKAAMERSSAYVEKYVKHLPEVGLGELGKPGISHLVLEHEDWCDLYSGRGTVCNCEPNVRLFVEPKRT